MSQDQTLTAEQQAELDEAKKQMEAMMPKPIYHNAPEDMDKAIERIIELELRLGDLQRAAEIACVVKDFNLVEAFIAPAGECLEKKIEVEYPGAGHGKLTVVTGTYGPSQHPSAGTP